MLLRALWHPIASPPSYVGGTWGDMGRFEHVAPKTKSSSRSCAAAGLQSSRGSLPKLKQCSTAPKVSSSGLIHPCLQVRSVAFFFFPSPSLF